MSDGRCVQAIGAGVDYVRWTAQTDLGREKLLGAGRLLFDQQRASGFEKGVYATKWYRGWSIGTVSYGEGRQGSILQVSGASAHPASTRLSPEDIKCTRIDVQVSYALPEDDPDYWRRLQVAALESEAYAALKSKPSLGETGKIGKGYTLTVGSRASEQYGRVYDKGREKESAYPLGSWRHEVEFKKDMAQRVFERFAGVPEKAPWCSAMVRNWFAFRGVPCEWPEDGQALPMPYERRKTDAEAQIAWIVKSVAPTVAKLIEAGYEQELMAALFSKVSFRNRENAL